MKRHPDPRVEHAANQAEVHLHEIARLFVPEARITLIVRVPGDDEADLVLSIDDLGEAIKALQRRHQ